MHTHCQLNISTTHSNAKNRLITFYFFQIDLGGKSIKTTNNCQQTSSKFSMAATIFNFDFFFARCLNSRFGYRKQNFVSSSLPYQFFSVFLFRLERKRPPMLKRWQAPRPGRSLRSCCGVRCRSFSTMVSWTWSSSTRTCTRICRQRCKCFWLTSQRCSLVES